MLAMREKENKAPGATLVIEELAKLSLKQLKDMQATCANKALLGRLPDGGQRLLARLPHIDHAIAVKEREAAKAETEVLRREKQLESVLAQDPDKDLLRTFDGLRVSEGREVKESGPRQAHVRVKPTQVSRRDVDSLYESLAKARISTEGEVEVSKHVRTPLLQHQIQGLRFLLAREEQDGEVPFRGGIVADDCGLGKTLQMIALIATSKETHRKRTPKSTLVICPRAVLKQWSDEVSKHVEAGFLSVHTYYGAARNRDMKFVTAHDVVLTTYALVMSEAASASNGRGGGSLQDVQWHRIVIDEGHVIRNPVGKTTLAVCALRADRRWYMSGTPIQNSLRDVWSAFRFLHFHPYDDPAVWKAVVPNEGTQALKRLQAVLSSVVLRRTKDDRKPDGTRLVALPNRTVKVVNIQLTPREREFYDVLWKSYQATALSLLGSTSAGKRMSKILVMLCRLRQTCAHFLLATGFHGENLGADDRCPLLRAANTIALQLGGDGTPLADCFASLSVAPPNTSEQKLQTVRQRGSKDGVKEEDSESTEDESSGDTDTSSGHDSGSDSDSNSDDSPKSKSSSSSSSEEDSEDEPLDRLTKAGSSKAKLIYEATEKAPVTAIPPKTAVTNTNGIRRIPKKQSLEADVTVVNAEATSHEKLKAGSNGGQRERDSDKERQRQRGSKEEDDQRQRGSKEERDQKQRGSKEQQHDGQREKAKSQESKHTHGKGSRDAKLPVAVPGALQKGEGKNGGKDGGQEKGQEKGHRKEKDRMSGRDKANDDLCGICCDVLTPATVRAITPCNHSFCWDCIAGALENEHKHCPICRKHLKISQLERLESERSWGGEWQQIAEEGAKFLYVIGALQKMEQTNPEDKAVIFSQWTSMLDLMEPLLQDRGFAVARLDGSMSSSEQAQNIEAFNESPDVRVFLVSLKAGGVGLNLVAANHLFLLDIWWNPAIEQQAFDRVYRVGQRKHVFIHRLIVKDSVEERLERLQKGKQALAREALHAATAAGPTNKRSNGVASLSELRALFA